MRLLTSIVAALLVSTMSNGSVAAAVLPSTCKDVTLEGLGAYLTQTDAHLKALRETTWEVEDPAKPGSKITVKLSDALKVELEAAERVNQNIIKTCAEAILKALQTEPQAPQKPSPQPKPVEIVIEKASYGDHALQAACEDAWSSRGKLWDGARRGAQSECSFVCDALEPLRMRCAQPVAPSDLSFMKKGSLVPVKGSEKLMLGSEEVVGILAGSSAQPFCSFTVDEDLCYRIDPSPDSPKKTLELSYSCKGDTASRPITAAKGAVVQLACAKKAN